MARERQVEQSETLVRRIRVYFCDFFQVNMKSTILDKVEDLNDKSFFAPRFLPAAQSRSQQQNIFPFIYEQYYQKHTCVHTLAHSLVRP